MDGRGMRDRSKKLISDFLQRHPKDKHILIAAANDSSALGAVDAVRELKRERHVAIVGQDCIAEAIAEMRKEQVAADRFDLARGEYVWAELDPSGADVAAGADGGSVQLCGARVVTRSRWSRHFNG